MSAQPAPLAGRRMPPIFDGGRRLMLAAAATGVAGLLATLLLGLFSAPQALYSYLTAFAYWFGIAIGSLIWIQTFHASRSRWVVVVRRCFEIGASTLPLFALLFLPIALGMSKLYSWVTPASLDEETRRLVEHKHSYLNPTFFAIRAALFFAIWIVVAELLRRWSARQDASGDLALTVRMRKLAPATLPPVAIGFTFAMFDWLMSLRPEWSSTIFGVYLFAGGFLAAVAVVIVAVVLLDRAGLFGDLLTPSHYFSLGKLLLAFVSFWGYIAFSQLLLIWIANLPAETVWYQVRFTGGPAGGWGVIGVALIVGHFVLPFLLLLSRPLKKRPLRLAAVAVWVLAIHWLDVYWIVMPRLHPEGSRPHASDLTALVGVGGLFVALAIFRARGRSIVPVGDPYLAQSAGYRS